MTDYNQFFPLPSWMAAALPNALANPDALRPASVAGANVDEVADNMSACDLATHDPLVETLRSHISSPQGPRNFYEILKVPRAASGRTITEAHVEQLVSIPFVAEYMERYVRAAATEWDALWCSFRHFQRNPAGGKARYEELMHAHAKMRTGDASDQCYEVLGVTRRADPNVAGRALKVKLLQIPRCDLAILLYPGAMSCPSCDAEQPSPTSGNLERWEQVRVADYILVMIFHPKGNFTMRIWMRIQTLPANGGRHGGAYCDGEWAHRLWKKMHLKGVSIGSATRTGVHARS